MSVTPQLQNYTQSELKRQMGLLIMALNSLMIMCRSHVNNELINHKHLFQSIFFMSPCFYSIRLFFLVSLMDRMQSWQLSGYPAVLSCGPLLCLSCSPLPHAVLGFRSRALCVLGKAAAIALCIYPQPLAELFSSFQWHFLVLSNFLNCFQASWPVLFILVHVFVVPAYF